MIWDKYLWFFIGSGKVEFAFIGGISPALEEKDYVLDNSTDINLHPHIQWRVKSQSHTQLGPGMLFCFVCFQWAGLLGCHWRLAWRNTPLRLGQGEEVDLSWSSYQLLIHLSKDEPEKGGQLWSQSSTAGISSGRLFRKTGLALSKCLTGLTLLPNLQVLINSTWDTSKVWTSNLPS